MRTTTVRPSSKEMRAESNLPPAFSVSGAALVTPMRGRAAVADAARVRGERAMPPG
jgi:hypothetical protein